MFKKSLFLFIIFFLTTVPSFSLDDSSYMSLDEYEKLFELGFMDEDEINEDKSEDTFELKKKENINYKADDVIVPDISSGTKLKIEKTDFLEPYREVFKNQETGFELLKGKNLKIYSDNSKEMSDYMTNNLKTTTNLSFDVTKYLTLKTGYENWYVNPNASIGAKKFFFNPKLKLTESFYLDYISRYNCTSKNYESELGLNYKPRFFKDTANFSIKASSVINQNNETQSSRLKFTSDWYIF